MEEAILNFSADTVFENSEMHGFYHPTLVATIFTSVTWLQTPLA